MPTSPELRIPLYQTATEPHACLASELLFAEMVLPARVTNARHATTFRVARAWPLFAGAEAIERHDRFKVS
jgi:hypothetical protein